MAVDCFFFPDPDDESLRCSLSSVRKVQISRCEGAPHLIDQLHCTWTVTRVLAACLEPTLACGLLDVLYLAEAVENRRVEKRRTKVSA